jgi:hypothetical protein
MIQRLLFFVAGVDRNTILECPATDRMWAAHIGFALCLSFTVVFGIAYFATGYMIEDQTLRVAIALVIAATVFMFDRALFQSDWFVQGAFRFGEDGVARTGGFGQLVGQFLRVAVRLTMSLGLAWVIALFLELALFSDSISGKIERDRIAANRPAFDQIATFEAELDAQIAARESVLRAREQAVVAALAESPVADNAHAQRGETDQRAKALADSEAALRGEIRQIEASIQQQIADMNAEELGQKLNPANSGRTGQGPRFEFAKRQKEALESLLQARQGELVQIAARQEELRKADAERAAAAAEIGAESRAALAAKRAALQAQVDAARSELQKAEADKTARLEQFRRSIMERAYVQAKHDSADPLIRIAAYQELKSDPKDGRTITLFSWMTRFLVIFLEIVPVIAKIFFSPPSAYAVKVRDEVRRARQRITDRAEAEQDGQRARSPAPAAVSGRVTANLQPTMRARMPVGGAAPATPAATPADIARTAPSNAAPKSWWRRGRSGTSQTEQAVVPPPAKQPAPAGQPAPVSAQPVARARPPEPPMQPTAPRPAGTVVATARRNAEPVKPNPAAVSAAAANRPAPAETKAATPAPAPARSAAAALQPAAAQPAAPTSAAAQPKPAPYPAGRPAVGRAAAPAIAPADATAASPRRTTTGPIPTNGESPAEAAAKLIDMMSEELAPATGTRGKR